MIYERITKGFWGRYFFYLFVFVAVYFLMREKVDELVFGLLGSWIVSKHYPLVAIFVFSILLFYPFTRIISKNKRKPLVDASLLAYILIPVSVWFTIQMGWESKWVYYFQNGSILIIVLWFTIYYLIVLLVDWFTRPKIDHSVVSLLLKDEPIDSLDEDKLGFSIYAESIATNIRNIVDNKRSFVFGIEGRWGSGKTSFINLVKGNLKKDPAIIILDFNPWKSSSVQQMTIDFFNLMAENVSEIRLKAKFREYGKVLATADGTGMVGHLVDRICPNQDLGAILDSINDSIKRRDLRFVVIVDDIDRMDKEEMLAVFKLVRNTAGFSNTIFVLTYDRDYVESVLKSYFDDERIAKAYPDKIINFQFELPTSTKDYYEILKKEINDSKFIQAHLEIGLKDHDLPKGVATLFDNYRKIKRVFNALVVESGFPHFEVVPVKYTLVFAYISYYQPEELILIRDTFCSMKNPLEENSEGKHLLRLIQESQGISDSDSSDFGEPSSVEKTNKNETRQREQNEFNSRHPLLCFLLVSENGANLFVKNLEFFLRSDSVDYTKNIENYKKYGVTGFNDIELKLSNSDKILYRLIEIRDIFNAGFYTKCGNNTFREFTSKGTNVIYIGENELENYFELVLALIFNTNNVIDNLYALLSITNKHFSQFKNSSVDLLTILEKLDETDEGSTDLIVGYYNNFPPTMRYTIGSFMYEKIIKEPGGYELFNVEKVTCSARKHLRKVIESNLSYDLAEEAFFSCGGLNISKQINSNFKIDSGACNEFRQYVEKYPDNFIERCISKSKEANFVIGLHPFLMQIFSNDKVEVRKYFNNVVCNTPKSLFMLDMIRKYLETYLSDEVQSHEFLSFSVEEDDYDKIFNYSDEDGEVVEEQPEQLEQTLLL